MASRSCPIKPSGASADIELQGQLQGLVGNIEWSHPQAPPIQLSSERVADFVYDLQFFMELQFGRDRVDDYDSNDKEDDWHGDDNNDNSSSHAPKKFKSEHSGSDSSNSTLGNSLSLVKLPAAFFRGPFSPSSPLLNILGEYISFQMQQGIQDMQISNPNNLQKSLELMTTMYNSLQTSKLLKYPIFYINNVPARKKAYLKRAIELRRGTWIDDEQRIAEASHIVICLPEEDCDSGSSSSNSNSSKIESYEYKEKSLKRIMRRRASDSMCLVHWRFYPDSYDEWITNVESDTSISQLSGTVDEINKQWVVSSRFIRDCLMYNEWGDEIDYELQVIPPKIGSQVDSMSMKTEPSSSLASSSSSSLATPSLKAVQGKHPDPMSASKKRKSDISDRIIPGFASSMPSIDTSNIMLLKPPAWFSLDAVSMLEMRYLAELFAQGSKLSLDSYIKVRNQIISLYEAAPLIYLSGTDVRRSSRFSGDCSVLLRIRDFLDSFGVINQNVKAECRPPINTSYMKNTDDFLGHYFKSPLDLNTGGNSNSFYTYNPSIWTSTMDNSLMANFLRHGGNWDKIAVAVSLNNDVVTREDCIVRFVTLPISPRFGQAMHLGTDPIPSVDVERDLQNRFIFKALELLNREDFFSSLISSCKTASTAVESDTTTAHSVSVVSSIITLQDTAAASIAHERRLLDSMFKDYMEVRADIFDKRVAALGRIEALLESDRERLDVERRDIFIQRAQLSHIGPGIDSSMSFLPGSIAGVSNIGMNSNNSGSNMGNITINMSGNNTSKVFNA